MAKFNRKQRRGMAVPEWFCVVGVLAIAMFGYWALLGEAAKTQLSTTATSVGTPANLTKQFGNNGVGNGEDGAPPGLPPENDGSGTSPGDPGLAGS